MLKQSERKTSDSLLDRKLWRPPIMQRRIKWQSLEELKATASIAVL